MKQFIFKTLVITIAALLMLSAFIPAFAESAFPDAVEAEELQIDIELFDAAGANTFVHLLPGYGDSGLLLFLPSGYDRNNLKLTFPDKSVSINGVTVESGSKTDVFRNDGEYEIVNSSGKHILKVVSSDSLPSVYITTESGNLDSIHADKNYKESASFSLVDNGKVELDGAVLSYIKGRGNSSWKSNEKRCYNIKFDDEVSILGMKAAKKWALISNNMDATLMRNAIAYSAAKMTDLPYTVDFAFIDLYINGSYRGNYMICERVEIGLNRIDISDLEEANKKANPGIKPEDCKKAVENKGSKKICWSEIPNNPDNISGGYLLEYEYPEQFDIQPSAFTTECGSCLVIHSPEYATEKEVRYISGLYYEFEDALMSDDGYNKLGRHFTEYIDIDSFIDGLIVYEMTADQDRGHTSWYLYVPENSNKFFMGPLWDFDQSMENPDEIPPCILSLAKYQLNGGFDYNDPDALTFTSLLCSHREFTDLLIAEFNEKESIFTGELNKKVSELFGLISASAEADRIRWNYDSLQKKDSELPNYITARVNELKAYYSDVDASVESAVEYIMPSERDTSAIKSIPKWAVITAAAVLLISIGTVSAIFRRKKKHI